MESRRSPSPIEDFVIVHPQHSLCLALRPRHTSNQAEEVSDASMTDDELEHVSRPPSVRSFSTIASQTSTADENEDNSEEQPEVQAFDILLGRDDMPSFPETASQRTYRYQSQSPLGTGVLVPVSPAGPTLQVPPAQQSTAPSTAGNLQRRSSSCSNHLEIDRHIVDMLIEHALNTRLEAEFGSNGVKERHLRQQMMARLRSLPIDHPVVKEAMATTEWGSILFSQQMYDADLRNHIYTNVFTEVEKAALFLLLKCHEVHFAVACHFVDLPHAIGADYLEGIDENYRTEGLKLAREIQTACISSIDLHGIEALLSDCHQRPHDCRMVMQQAQMPKNMSCSLVSPADLESCLATTRSGKAGPLDMREVGSLKSLYHQRAGLECRLNLSLTIFGRREQVGPRSTNSDHFTRCTARPTKRQFSDGTMDPAMLMMDPPAKRINIPGAVPNGKDTMAQFCPLSARMPMQNHTIKDYQAELHRSGTDTSCSTYGLQVPHAYCPPSGLSSKQPDKEAITSRHATTISRQGELSNLQHQASSGRECEQRAPYPLEISGTSQLQDYQMQLMLLEQQNRKRLMLQQKKVDDAIKRYVEQTGSLAWRCKVPDSACSKLFAAYTDWKEHIECEHDGWLHMLKGQLGCASAISRPLQLTDRPTSLQKAHEFKPGQSDSPLYAGSPMHQPSGPRFGIEKPSLPKTFQLPLRLAPTREDHTTTLSEGTMKGFNSPSPDDSVSSTNDQSTMVSEGYLVQPRATTQQIWAKKNRVQSEDTDQEPWSAWRWQDNSSQTERPVVVRQDHNGIVWAVFEHKRDDVLMEYTIRCDTKSVDVNALSDEFKLENIIAPEPAIDSKHMRRTYRNGTHCCLNDMGWALSELNPCLRGKRDLIRHAAEIYRDYIDTDGGQIRSDKPFGDPTETMMETSTAVSSEVTFKALPSAQHIHVEQQQTYVETIRNRDLPAYVSDHKSWKLPAAPSIRGAQRGLRSPSLSQPQNDSTLKDELKPLLPPTDTETLQATAFIPSRLPFGRDATLPLVRNFDIAWPGHDSRPYSSDMQPMVAKGQPPNAPFLRPLQPPRQWNDRWPHSRTSMKQPDSTKPTAESSISALPTAQSPPSTSHLSGGPTPSQQRLDLRRHHNQAQMENDSHCLQDYETQLMLLGRQCRARHEEPRFKQKKENAAAEPSREY